MTYPLLFTIHSHPVPKPRGRQLRIYGRETPVGVLAWRAFKDAAQKEALVAGWRPTDAEPLMMFVASYHAIPASYSRKQAQALAGQPHRTRPDQNHVWNAVADALFPRDERLSTGMCGKFWDAGGGARVVVVLCDNWPKPRCPGWPESWPTVEVFDSLAGMAPDFTDGLDSDGLDSAEYVKARWK